MLFYLILVDCHMVFGVLGNGGICLSLLCLLFVLRAVHTFEEQFEILGHVDFYLH